MAIAAGGTFAGLALAGGGAAGPGSLLLQTETGPERLVRAYGLAGAPRKFAFTLRNGDGVESLSTATASCLVEKRSGQVAGEACAPNESLAAGQGITVSDECGTSSNNSMEITGLAPSGTTRVALLYSDGTSVETSVVSGAFRFEGTNPAAGEPYPRGVRWLDGSPSSPEAPLPVDEDKFCLPAE